MLLNIIIRGLKRGFAERTDESARIKDKSPYRLFLRKKMKTIFSKYHLTQSQYIDMMNTLLILAIMVYRSVSLQPKFHLVTYYNLTIIQRCNTSNID